MESRRNGPQLSSRHDDDGDRMGHLGKLNLQSKIVLYIEDKRLTESGGA